jgi:hypothetical protein
MKCNNCGAEMKHYDKGYLKGYMRCPQCNNEAIQIKMLDESVYIKQEPYINDEGIWVPYEEYVPEGCAANYKLLMSRELFIEAYNKWIRKEV